MKKSMKKVLAVLKSAKSVREASDVLLVQYEAPADQSEAVKVKRAGYGQKYYEKYHPVPPLPAYTDLCRTE